MKYYFQNIWVRILLAKVYNEMMNEYYKYFSNYHEVKYKFHFILPTFHSILVNHASLRNRSFWIQLVAFVLIFSLLFQLIFLIAMLVDFSFVVVFVILVLAPQGYSFFCLCNSLQLIMQINILPPSLFSCRISIFIRQVY